MCSYVPAHARELAVREVNYYWNIIGKLIGAAWQLSGAVLFFIIRLGVKLRCKINNCSTSLQKLKTDTTVENESINFDHRTAHGQPYTASHISFCYLIFSVCWRVFSLLLPGKGKYCSAWGRNLFIGLRWSQSKIPSRLTATSTIEYVHNLIPI